MENTYNDSLMWMRFEFDNAKLNECGYTKEQCLNHIRKRFKRYSNEILEPEEGFFVGTDDDFSAFSVVCNVVETKWFLRVIKNWYVSLGDEPCDAIAVHYEVKNMGN